MFPHHTIMICFVSFKQQQQQQQQQLPMWGLRGKARKCPIGTVSVCQRKTM